MSTSFRTLAELCEELEATSKRLRMISLVSDFFNGLESDEMEPAVNLILGRPFPNYSQKTLDVSWVTVSKIIKRTVKANWKVFMEAFSETGDVGSATRILFESGKIGKQETLLGRELTILEVRRSFEAIAETVGMGSREKKERLIESLLNLASPLEAKYLVKIFIGEMRTGFNQGLMEQAISKAFQISLNVVQRASMILGDVGEVASLTHKHGEEALVRVEFKVFRPVKLMLAQRVSDVEEALVEHGNRTIFEYKLDGARVQIHKLGDEVRIFSRRLTDVTKSLPELVKTIKKNVKAEEGILEGEVIAVDDTGQPIPFQHLMRRFRRVHKIDEMVERIPVKLFLFDILYLDGENLISTPYIKRRKILAENIKGITITRQLITTSVKEAETFLKEAINNGHEGLMAKKIDSEYIPGIRGKNWFKIKTVLEPLDLVIVGAEYGYGRRHKWLSDYYLAAMDTQSREFMMVGKTFKGLTDMEIIRMTKRLKELIIKPEGRRVVVVPKIVVEVFYNEIQRSPKYKSGMALRFARINRVRDDKTIQEADTLQKVREIYKKQFKKKGRYTSD